MAACWPALCPVTRGAVVRTWHPGEHLCSEGLGPGGCAFADEMDKDMREREYILNTLNIHEYPILSADVMISTHPRYTRDSMTGY